MFTKVNVPILGLVQNMSSYSCTNCGHVEHIFGSEGVKRLADEYKCEVIGDVPLNAGVRLKSDEGQPICLDAQSPAAGVFRLIGRNLLDKLKI